MSEIKVNLTFQGQFKGDPAHLGQSAQAVLDEFRQKFPAAVTHPPETIADKLRDGTYTITIQFTSVRAQNMIHAQEMQTCLQAVALGKGFINK